LFSNEKAIEKTKNYDETHKLSLILSLHHGFYPTQSGVLLSHNCGTFQVLPSYCFGPQNQKLNQESFAVTLAGRLYGNVDN